MVSLLKLNSMEKVTLIIKGLLGNLVTRTHLYTTQAVAAAKKQMQVGSGFRFRVEPVFFFFFFCCLVFFVVGSLKDEPGRPVSE